MAKDATFSEFLRDPNRVIRSLKAGSVTLHRRGGKKPLKLSLQDTRLEQTSFLLASLLNGVLSDAAAADRMLKALEDSLPWVTFLPTIDKRSFLGEFVACARASASVGTTSALEQLIHEWKTTAAIYSDPAFLEKVRKRSLTFDGPSVPRP